nr:hypothetical protein [Candidatus Protochlamydia amoebophila]
MTLPFWRGAATTCMTTACAQGRVGGVLPALLQAPTRELLEVQGQGGGLG